MKTKSSPYLNRRSVGWLLLAWTLLLPRGGRAADVIAHPARIHASYRFGNADPDIVSRLSSARSVQIHAGSVAPAPPLQADSTQSIPAGPTAFDADLEVEGSPPGAAGYAYSVTGRLLASQQYFLKPVISAPLNEGGVSMVEVSDCPALLNIRFVERPGGPPVSVNQASIFVMTEGQPFAHAIVYNAAGEGYKLLAHSGEVLHIQTVYSRGTDPTSDRLTFYAEERVTAPLSCDQTRDVEIVVPTGSTLQGLLGKIVGEVGMVGEEPVPHDGPAYSLNTILVADAPPYGDDFTTADRYTFLNRRPSAGHFELPNLLPSETFVPWFGVGTYRVWGRMQFRHGRAVNYFRIPSLLGTSRPYLARGGSVDLGDTFVLRPGYIRGRVLLRGPADLPGRPSGLRHLSRLSDSAGTDGDPAGGAWLLGTYSSLEATGVNRLAPGATDTAYEGVGVTEFDGDYDPARGELEGQYELVLAGLKGQASVWNASRLNLAFNSDGSSDPYVAGNLRITDRRASEVIVEPGVRQVRDRQCCFGEVLIRFHTPAATPLYQPSVGVRGEFNGTDRWGQPADYLVETAPGMLLGTGVPVPFQGEPHIAAHAAPEGVVRLFLPEGTYTLAPALHVLAAGVDSQISLAPLSNVVVHCEDRIEMTTCLAVDIPTLPSCLREPRVSVTGSVRSCTNVVRLAWTRGDNIEHVLCENCGVSPSFTFELPVDDRCADQTFTVIARDAGGDVAQVTRTIAADRTPPVITPPADVTVACTSPAGATVSYVVGASDECGLASLTATPASGTVFPIGTTSVECVARDLCGNETRRRFNVIVTGGCAANGDCQTNQANLLINGSLEEPGIPDFYWPVGAGDPLITGWKATGAGVEYHVWLSPGTVYPVAAEGIALGRYAVDLAGANGPGGIEQTFPTIPGQAYIVSFQLGTSAERGRTGQAKVRVSAAGHSEEFSMNNDTPHTYFTRHSMRFIAAPGTTTTTLALSTTESPALAFVEIDDIAVQRDCQAPPPPACLEFSCPSNLLVTTCNTNGATASYNVWATNRCQGSVSVRLDPPSGTMFPLGTTDVWATIAGSGETNRCHFTVTVVLDPQCGGLPGSCSTNLLVNGSFEVPGVPDSYVALAPETGVLAGWTTVLNGIEYYNPRASVPPSVDAGVAAEGNYVIDLAGISGPGGGIRQSFATVVGRTYHVRFAFGTARDRGRTGRASLVVTVAGQAHAFNIATDSPSIEWTRKSFSFVATDPVATLVFCTLDDPAASFVNLDDVRVTDCCEEGGLTITPTVTLEWSCGILQSASDVTGPYTDVLGAASPYTAPVSGPRRFWRVRN